MEVCWISFISCLSVLRICLSNPFSLIFPTGFTFHLLSQQKVKSYSLCSRAQHLDSHLSTSVRLPSWNPFPCHSPRQRRPPVSSFSRHKESLARGSDNPVDPSSVICQGKSTHLIGGKPLRGWRAGVEVVILVLEGSEVKKGRSHRWLASFMCRSGGTHGQGECLLGSWGEKQLKGNGLNLAFRIIRPVNVCALGQGVTHRQTNTWVRMLKKSQWF